MLYFARDTVPLSAWSQGQLVVFVFALIRRFGQSNQQKNKAIDFSFYSPELLQITIFPNKKEDNFLMYSIYMCAPTMSAGHKPNDK